MPNSDAAVIRACASLNGPQNEETPSAGVLLVSPRGTNLFNAAIAWKMGISSVMIIKWERGMHKPQPGSLERVECFRRKHGPEYLRERC